MQYRYMVILIFQLKADIFLQSNQSVTGFFGKVGIMGMCRFLSCEMQEIVYFFVVQISQYLPNLYNNFFMQKQQDNPKSVLNLIKKSAQKFLIDNGQLSKQAVVTSFSIHDINDSFLLLGANDKNYSINFKLQYEEDGSFKMISMNKTLKGHQPILHAKNLESSSLTTDTQRQQAHQTIQKLSKEVEILSKKLSEVQAAAKAEVLEHIRKNGVKFGNHWSIQEESVNYLVFRNSNNQNRDFRYAMSANRYTDL